MLTEDKYAGWLKDAYDALDDTKKAYFKPVIDEMATDAEDLGLGENGAYALAWIKLWVENYNEQTDDGPICNTICRVRNRSGRIISLFQTSFRRRVRRRFLK